MTTYWLSVARKDFEDAVRSKMVWGAMGLFIGLMSLLLTAFDAGDVVGGGAEGGIVYVAQWSQQFIPIIALVTAYMAILGERRSGSLRILLSYPFTRRDIVAGKLVGRSVVITVTLLVAFAVSGLITLLLFGSVPLVKLTLLSLVTVLFGLSFIGIAVGVSAGVSTRGQALVMCIGLFVLCYGFWDGAASAAYSLVTGARPGLHPEPWYFLIERLNPIESYRVLANAVLDLHVEQLVGLHLENLPESTSPEQFEAANRVRGDLPFYLQNWFSGLILVGWTVIPVVLGYFRFKDSDLG